MMSARERKRLGILTKTPDSLTYSGHTYGNTHRGFIGRRPTPMAKEFHGLGSTLYGDGKIHYYGNDMGQADLAPAGFYGLSGSEADYQIADMMITGDDPDPNQAPGYGGYMDQLTDSTNIAWGLLVIGVTAWYFKRKK